MSAYQSYFDNFFATLPISRVNFKALGNSALLAVREAKLGADFDRHEQELQDALAGFDENLLDASETTGGTTEAFRTARKAWLTFVDDTMKDYVTPRLRKLPVYVDFRQYGKSRLNALTQDELLLQSKQLLALYAAHAAALQNPALPKQAEAAYQALVAADDTRETTDAVINGARVALAADWLTLARALRRLKAQLELRYDEPAEVYRFFDFSKARKTASARRAAAKARPVSAA